MRKSPDSLVVNRLRQDIKQRCISGAPNTTKYIPGLNTMSDIHLKRRPLKEHFPGNISSPDIKVVIGKGRSRSPMNLSSPLIIDTPALPHLRREYVMSYVGAALRMGIGAVLDLDQCPEITLKDLEGWEEYPGSLILRLGAKRRWPDMNTINLADALLLDITGISTPTANWPMDIHSHEDLSRFALMLKEVSEYRVPIILKIPGGSVEEDVITALHSNFDLIVLDDGSNIIPDNYAMAQTLTISPTAILGAVRQTIQKGEIDLKGIKFGVSTDIWTGEDIIKYKAMGASVVLTSTPALVAWGCTLCSKCRSGVCEAGLFNNNEVGLTVEEGTRRIANLIMSYNSEGRMCLETIGIKRLSDISVNDLTTSNYDIASTTGIALEGYGKHVPMWEG